jgi:hypothetical protein
VPFVFVMFFKYTNNQNVINHDSPGTQKVIKIFNNLYSIDALLDLNLMSTRREFRLSEGDLWSKKKEEREKLQKLSNWLVVNLKTDI